ncbi:MAG: hypothetical protein ACFFDC_04425 [Promethearchaeota archaeon]
MVRLKSKKKKAVLLLLIIVLFTRMVYVTPLPEIGNKIEENTLRNIKQNTNFRIEIPSPEYYIEYWETVNITIEITELKNRAWTNLRTELEWKDEGKLFLTEGENPIHNLGDIQPNETITTNYTICACQQKLTNPVEIGHVYLYQEGVQQVVETASWFEDEYSEWGVLNYGLFGIEIQYPLMTIDGPLEVSGVIPVLELAFGENTTITYNITNISNVDLKNLTFITRTDSNLVEITSKSFDLLNTLPNKSSTLFEINLLCKATEETETILYLDVNTTILGLIQSSLTIKIIAEHLALNYDNRLVFYSWPILIFSFAVLGLLIIVFSYAKRARTIRIEKELEEMYGKSYID